MSGIKLTNEDLSYIAAFEGMTRIQVKDCVILEDRIIFVVKDLRKALGKDSSNVRRLKEAIGKNVDVIGYSSKPEKFVKNIFHNYRVKEVNIEDMNGTPTAVVKIEPGDKGRAIGKNRKNLNVAEEILSRHFSIEKIFID
ncbi:MAG: NusA-like transcription termination signal-binding factor [Thermoplasmata archaeon]|nr:NusA-like transcription termination signal-binding factor [Thermoplasmata archaeon]